MTIHSLYRPAAHFCMAGGFIAPQPLPRRFIERRQQIERDIGRLIVPRIRARYVMTERPERSLARKRLGLRSGGQIHRVQARHQSGGDRFHIALDARNLAGKQDFRRARNCSVGESSAGALIYVLR